MNDILLSLGDTVIVCIFVFAFVFTFFFMRL